MGMRVVKLDKHNKVGDFKVQDSVERNNLTSVQARWKKCKDSNMRVARDSRGKDYLLPPLASPHFQPFGACQQVCT